ncbi:MAG: hypothetical protein RR310_01215 [Eubacterium sp.]
MEHFYGLLKNENTRHWTFVNQIILHSEKGDSFYYPDILERHPFNETSLTLNSDTLLADTIIAIFKKFPPHQIILLKVNDDPLEAQIFKNFKHSRDNRDVPSFFTLAEKEAMDAIGTTLHLTESQKIILRKACIANKLRLNAFDPSLLTAILKSFSNKKVTNKNERRSAFNALTDNLWR